MLGLVLWLVPDTGLTVWYCLNGYPGPWPKIVNDFSFVLMFGIPYAALYHYCCKEKRLRRPGLERRNGR